jgi:thiamine biosynthesis lipoprotein
MQEYEYITKAMGTDVSISIVSKDKDLADKLGHQTIEEINRYETIFSRFLIDSELSKLNREKQMTVSLDFIEVIQEAYELFILTKGHFNPLVQIARLGYTKDFKQISSQSDTVDNEMYSIDFSLVQIDAQNLIVKLDSGQKLDFGGFLKGYLAEKLCKKIKTYSNDITGVIVNIGGDLHTQGFDSENKIFIFSIYNPITQEDILIPIHNKSLATSGTYKRTWKHSNMLVHHILDNNGMENSKNEIVSMSIIHEHGGLSEAYAKTFMLLGHSVAQKEFSKDKITFISINKSGHIAQNIR